MHRGIVHRSTTGGDPAPRCTNPPARSSRKGTDVRRVLVGAAAGAVVLVVAAVAVAQIISGVPNANPRSGSPANVVANGFSLQRVVTGNENLENPAGHLQPVRLPRRLHAPDRRSADQDRARPEHVPGHAPQPGRPDGRLRLRPSLPDPGPRGLHAFGGDVQPRLLHAHQPRRHDHAHRVTLLNPLPADATDSGVRSIDGSTYDPFSGQLLFTAEAGNLGGVFGQPLKWSGTTAPAVANYDGSMGKAGLRGHPQRQARQPHHHRGRRAAANVNADARQAAQLLRLPLQAGPRRRPDQGQAPGPAGLGQRDADHLPHGRDRRPGGRVDDALGEPIMALHSGDAQQVKWVDHPRHRRRRHDRVRRERRAKAGGSAPTPARPTRAPR